MRNTFLVILHLMLLHSLSATARINKGSWGTVTLNVGERKTLYEQVDTRFGRITSIHWIVEVASGYPQTISIVE